VQNGVNVEGVKMRFDPSKRALGPHMLFTEAQTLDEALDIIKFKNKRKYVKSCLTLQQEFNLNKGRQLFKSVTLSDRIILGLNPGRRQPKVKKLAVLPWTKERVVQVFNEGWFKPQELAKMAGVSTSQIKRWIWGEKWRPNNWHCKICCRSNNSSEHCSKTWKEQYP
jgi:hypothetical protein